MDWFDFASVATTMKALGWKWAQLDGGRVPDVSEIREFARERLEEASCRKSNYSACGGFEAEYDPDSSSLSLRFCVDEWTTEEQI